MGAYNRATLESVHTFPPAPQTISPDVLNLIQGLQRQIAELQMGAYNRATFERHQQQMPPHQDIRQYNGNGGYLTPMPPQNADHHVAFEQMRLNDEEQNVRTDLRRPLQSMTSGPPPMDPRMRNQVPNPPPLIHLPRGREAQVHRIIIDRSFMEPGQSGVPPPTHIGHPNQPHGGQYPGRPQNHPGHPTQIPPMDAHNRAALERHQQQMPPHQDMRQYSGNVGYPTPMPPQNADLHVAFEQMRLNDQQQNMRTDLRRPLQSMTSGPPPMDPRMRNQVPNPPPFIPPPHGLEAQSNGIIIDRPPPGIQFPPPGFAQELPPLELLQRQGMSPQFQPQPQPIPLTHGGQLVPLRPSASPYPIRASIDATMNTNAMGPWIPQRTTMNVPPKLIRRPYGFPEFPEMYPTMEGDLRVLIHAYQSGMMSVDPKQIIDIFVQRSPGEMLALRNRFREKTRTNWDDMIIHHLKFRGESKHAILAFMGLALGSLPFDLYLLNNVSLFLYIVLIIGERVPS